MRFWGADDGVGIPQGDFTTVFDRFWQATKTDRRGAGLGLSIVTSLGERQGGRVGVECEAGSGATFYFTWPLRHP